MIERGRERLFLSDLYFKAVNAADPERALSALCPKKPRGRVIVVGAGKASSQMAAAFEKIWGEPCSGLVVARHGPVADTRFIRVMTAAHPIPDEKGLQAAHALLETVRGLTEDDLVIALISGGGSALLPLPPEGFALADEIELNRALLHAGAPIAAMNTVRQHFSQIKGGRLAAAAYPARVVTFVVSDVPGDDPALVASGPTIPYERTAADARAVIEDYRIALSPSVREAIVNAHAPKPSDAIFSKNEVYVIASAKQSLEAAADEVRNAGLTPVILSDSIEGEARDIGLMHAALAREIATRNRPFTRPVVMLSGGETTVTLTPNSKGRGGRNAECLLSFALAIDDLPGLYALMADTDGIDGTETNAGAFADGMTAAALRRAGLDGRALLRAHDSYHAFDRIHALFEPGPTGTNVNDFRAILIS